MSAKTNPSPAAVSTLPVGHTLVIDRIVCPITFLPPGEISPSPVVISLAMDAASNYVLGGWISPMRDGVISTLWGAGGSVISHNHMFTEVMVDQAAAQHDLVFENLRSWTMLDTDSAYPVITVMPPEMAGRTERVLRTFEAGLVNMAARPDFCPDGVADWARLNHWLNECLTTHNNGLKRLWRKRERKDGTCFGQPQRRHVSQGCIFGVDDLYTAPELALLDGRQVHVFEDVGIHCLVVPDLKKPWVHVLAGWVDLADAGIVSAQLLRAKHEVALDDTQTTSN